MTYDLLVTKKYDNAPAEAELKSGIETNYDWTERGPIDRPCPTFGC